VVRYETLKSDPLALGETLVIGDNDDVHFEVTVAAIGIISGSDKVTLLVKVPMVDQAAKGGNGET
jgi:hypothetical protein